MLFREDLGLEDQEGLGLHEGGVLLVLRLGEVLLQHVGDVEASLLDVLVQHLGFSQLVYQLLSLVLQRVL